MQKPTLCHGLIPYLVLIFLPIMLCMGKDAVHAKDSRRPTAAFAISEPVIDRLDHQDRRSQKGKRLKKRGYLRIATLGPKSLAVDVNEAPQKVVERIIAHWQREFLQVLPYRPDLIVVPEACDRPAGFSLDKRLAYYRVRKNQVLDFFAKTARDNNCYMVYSAAREMGDRTWRNSSILIDRQGNVQGIYNKNHLVIEETTKQASCADGMRRSSNVISDGWLSPSVLT